MRRITTILGLALISFPISSFAEDKKGPRPLAAEAASLAEKSGKNGWVSEEVTVSMDGGRKAAKGRLLMRFEADKGKPTGSVLLGIDYTYGSRDAGRRVRFELVEREGKRSIKIIDERRITALEYTIDAEKLTVKGGVVRKTWLGWDVDLTKATSFKAGGK
jgi:hypothetical protein